MKPGMLRIFSIIVLGVAVVPGVALAHDLTFEERVAAREALERVTYSHQIGATLPFEEAVPRRLLEYKVREYLKQSLALERIWHTPVTPEALDRELDRMTRETRMPDRLRELYRALGDDPVKIRECLARPVLVQRLARNFFEFDQEIHASARRQAENLQERLLGHWIDPAASHQGRDFVRYVPSRTAEESSVQGTRPMQAIDLESPGVWPLNPEEFDAWKRRAEGWSGGVSPVSEERDAFLVRVLLKEAPGEIDVATYSVPKLRWEEWWDETAPMLDEGRSAAKAAPEQGSGEAGPSRTGGKEPGSRAWEILSAEAQPLSQGCDPDNSWQQLTSPGDAPQPRTDSTAVWTGTLMLVWGGFGDRRLNDGGRYDPVTDTWSPISLAGAPEARVSHTAVWTGTEMIVWGGYSSTFLDTGGRYNPQTDTWSPVSSGAGRPSPREYHSAVWTGTGMIVWGGYDGTLTNNQYLQDGARYDPSADAWTPLSTQNAPIGRHGHVAVWTGSRMIVWGGTIYGQASNSGGRYDPGTDSWEPTSVDNAPEWRRYTTAVWTGSQMIVWGGSGISSTYLNTGGRYDPVADSWSATSTSGAPAGRYSHAAVWTGTRMVIWGGYSGWPYPVGYIATGGLYDPIADTWSPTSNVNAPAGRVPAGAVWTGSRMLVWGGLAGLSKLSSGGRYDPAGDSWTPTSGATAPSLRRYHTSVWTGSLLLIWGGDNGAPLNTGARFDPVTSTWTPITLSGAPDARYGHTAVWTGSQMVVWGGAQPNFVFLGTGGRYDPVSDVWTPVSPAGAPAGRYRHTAVWTGTRMIIWGGHIYGASTGTGGLYDPSSNTWTSTSVTGAAPSARELHVAVWTGSRMVVWGGVDQTGGLYDPVGDSWTPTSLTNAPSARQYATAVWTGSLMVVWGGDANGYLVNSGGRYNPTADTWSPTSMALVPTARIYHTAVWTGSLMIVWGGTQDSPTATGGRYEPNTDTWTATTIANVPAARSDHTATWIGDRMLVWGGVSGSSSLATLGGLFCSCATAAYFQDYDGDGYGDPFSWVHACAQPSGYVTNRLDCVDSNASVWGAPGEVPNLAFQDDVTLTWDPPPDPGGTSVYYDAVRSGDPADFVGAAACIADASAGTTLADGAQPTLGGVFNYLVRGRNDCPGLRGSLGSRSDGTPRTALICP